MRGDNSVQKYYSDISDTFVKLEENIGNLPMFVSDSFDTMPSCSGYEIISANMLSLIDEINLLNDKCVTFS